MANFNIKLMEEVEENLSKIYNYMDMEVETFLTREMGKVYTELDKALQHYAVLQATIKGILELDANYTEDSLYEACCEADEEYECLVETLEKVVNALD